MQSRPATRVLQQQPKQQQQYAASRTGSGSPATIPPTSTQNWQALAQAQASKQQQDL